MSQIAALVGISLAASLLSIGSDPIIYVPTGIMRLVRLGAICGDISDKKILPANTTNFALTEPASVFKTAGSLLTPCPFCRFVTAEC